MTKSMTLRLTDEQAAQLEAVAGIENLAVAEVVREAVARYIEERRRDAAFQRRLRASMTRNREIFESLATGGRQ